MLKIEDEVSIKMGLSQGEIAMNIEYYKNKELAVQEKCKAYRMAVSEMF